MSLAYLSYVFDIFHPPFWNAGLGDWIDPYFINYLLEHWYHAVSTLSDPWSPPMFYPAQKALGYSHSLILYAPFYVPVRLFLHPFQADSLSLFITIETGIICLYVIFRRFMQLSFVESLLLTTFFFTSQNVTNGSIGIWSQRASVFLVPPILLLSLVSFHHRPGRTRIVLAALSGFVAVLLFPHDFYSGHFTFVFAAMFLIAWACVEGHVSMLPIFAWRKLSGVERAALAATLIAAAWTLYLATVGGVRMRLLGIKIASQDWRRPALITLACATIATCLCRARIHALAKAALEKRRASSSAWLETFALGALLGGALFLWIYVPAYREHPRFPEQDLLSQIRVRAIPHWTMPLADLSAYLTARSFSIVAIAAILACVPRLKLDRQTRSYVFWAFGVSVVVLLMPIRIDRLALWLSVFRHIPGFSVIRDPTRIIFQYELAFVVAAGLLLARLRFQPIYRLGACLLFVGFMIADHRVEVLAYQRPVRDFHHWVESPIDVDPTCRSFFMKPASPAYTKRSDNIWALYGVDAMFIALRRELPTLNGYSAWTPEGWDFMNPPEADYRDRVRRWIVQNGLTNVCELDVEARTMRPAALN